MTTLSKRATPRQIVVMRMIAGAVRNAAHAHPDRKINHPLAAGSIAKRAAGTLTAGWPDVLAAPRVPSDRGGATGSMDRPADGGNFQAHQTGGERVDLPARSPLRHLHNQIGALAAEAKRAGLADRHAALVDVLRLIARA